MSTPLNVTIKEFEGRSIRRAADGSRPMVKLNKWRVFVDGRHAGFIGFADDSKLLLGPGFSEEEASEIEQQVMLLLDRDEVETAQAPDVPSDLFNEPESEDSDFGYDDN